MAGNGDLKKNITRVYITVELIVCNGTGVDALLESILGVRKLRGIEGNCQYGGQASHRKSHRGAEDVTRSFLR